MAELGIIAAVVQIADVGLRLSIKLYTFGEIVASADRSVISISKDVSLTSGVLKELGQILEKDKKVEPSRRMPFKRQMALSKSAWRYFRRWTAYW